MLILTLLLFLSGQLFLLLHFHLRYFKLLLSDGLLTWKGSRGTLAEWYARRFWQLESTEYEFLSY